MTTTAKTNRASISWEGDSLEVLQGWPKPIRVDFGHSLNLMQEGYPPKSDARPMQSIGNGVFELKESDSRTWYRTIYLSRVDGVIYVLHCFEKRSRKTDRRDLETAAHRLSQVKARLGKERQDEKKHRK